MENEISITNLKAIAWHLEQGHDNGTISKEGLAEFLRHVAKLLEGKSDPDSPTISIISQGSMLISMERNRQVDVEGWTPDHDDEEHMACELSMAASAYLRHAVGQVNGVCSPEDETEVPAEWPWDREWFKPSGPIRNLVKAGALIAAEIDRLQRELEQQ